MLTLKKVPWFSLMLVLLSYSTLGWVISEARPPLLVWPISIIAILSLLITFTAPLTKFNQYSSILFKNKIRTFGVTVLAAFLLFVMLAWFRVFLDTLLIISATILVKIDFQAAGFKPSTTFAFTSCCSLIGLAAGVLIYKLTT